LNDQLGSIGYAQAMLDRRTKRRTTEQNLEEDLWAHLDGRLIQSSLLRQKSAVVLVPDELDAEKLDTSLTEHL
jgi:hypothetical protein